MPLFKKILKWFLLILLIAFAALVVYRMFYLRNEAKTNEQVAKIHATKLTLDDVMGKNLPPDPGPLADQTVAGIDANRNGIRDDVELAIFKQYPASAKTRAVLLQYALALQMEVTQVIVSEGTVIAAIQEEDRSYLCVGKILSRDNMDKFISESDRLRLSVKDRQFNTEQRKKARKDFYDKIGSYESLDRVCDIDYSNLPN
ncbi:MAG: hypothetical protein HY007_04280 [Candidatus Sungbacteria bacterium]|nr:hypothetical protein [Candidatus Sungbacteria bacterium]